MTDREKLIELFYDNNVRCDQKIECLADDVMDIIANGVTVQKWISASEPPKEEGRYLCQMRIFGHPKLEYIDILTYDGYGFKEGYVYTERVKYWRPLPPKEGE